MAIVERGDDGGLYVPPELLRQFQPHAAFEIQTDADSILLRNGPRPGILATVDDCPARQSDSGLGQGGPSFSAGSHD